MKTSPDTDWHHIAITKVTSAGPTVEYGIYKDGTQIAYLSDNSTDTFAGPLYMGANFYNSAPYPGTYFGGNISHTRIQASNIFSASPNAGLTDTITVPTEAYTVASAPTGWANTINSIISDSIAKINSIPKANVSKVNQT